MIKLNRRIAAIKHSATLAADARVTEMRAAGIDVMPLAAGEPDFDTPERIKEAADRDEAAAFTAPEGSENEPETEPTETEEAEEAEAEPTEPAPEPEPAQPDTGLNAEQADEKRRVPLTAACLDG